MELTKSPNRRNRFGSDTSDLSDDLEVVRIGDVDEINISNKDAANTKELADNQLYGDQQAGKNAGSGSTEGRRSVKSF